MPRLKTEARKTKCVIIKVTECDYGKIQALAESYTGGNISRWVRYAAVHLKPRKCDLDPGDDPR